MAGARKTVSRFLSQAVGECGSVSAAQPGKSECEVKKRDINQLHFKRMCSAESDRHVEGRNRKTKLPAWPPAVSQQREVEQRLGQEWAGVSQAWCCTLVAVAEEIQFPVALC